MSCLGNILWLIFGGLLMMITIIGIPFGLQSIKLGISNFAPFGKAVVETGDAWSGLNLIFNLIWVVLFGWEIALIHLTSAALLFITIIGIPFAKQHFKLIPLALIPFGRELR